MIRIILHNNTNEHAHYFYRGQGLVLHEANWTTEVESRLRKFEKRIIFALKNEGMKVLSLRIISQN